MHDIGKKTDISIFSFSAIYYEMKTISPDDLNGSFCKELIVLG